jgi:hypothetical protein
MTTTVEGGEGSASRPGRSLPPGKTRYPLYRRVGGPQGRSGQVRKISPPPGFDLRTVQPVASRYTDWATRPTGILNAVRKYLALFTIVSNQQVQYFRHWNGCVCPRDIRLTSKCFPHAVTKDTHVALPCPWRWRPNNVTSRNLVWASGSRGHFLIVGCLGNNVTTVEQAVL